MKNIFKNIIILIILGVAIFVFRESIEEAFLQSREKLFPCDFPIKYSIGSFDDRFGIKEEAFLDSVKLAENIWENSINHKQLFTYDPNGDLKINLIYDNRQETTKKLSDLDFKIESDRKIYENLVSQYEILKNDYQKNKELIEIEIVSFQNRQREYEKDVTYWNDHGGAPKKEFERLSKEVTYLENKVNESNKQQTDLNQTVNKINDLVSQLNEFASKLNLKTKQYNNIGGELSEEFEEGLYTENGLDRKIDIYQFEDEDILIRLLVHELGHVLSLEHSENPGAIMYRLNIGGNLTLSKDDILMLKEHCQIK